MPRTSPRKSAPITEKQADKIIRGLAEVMRRLKLLEVAKARPARKKAA